MSLIPIRTLEEILKVLEYGLQKYTQTFLYTDREVFIQDLNRFFSPLGLKINYYTGLDAILQSIKGSFIESKKVSPDEETLDEYGFHLIRETHRITIPCYCSSNLRIPLGSASGPFQCFLSNELSEFSGVEFVTLEMADMVFLLHNLGSSHTPLKDFAFYIHQAIKAFNICVFSIKKVEIDSVQLSRIKVDYVSDSIQVTISGENNWYKGMDWSRCFNSLQRHLFAYWKGEDLDKESGLPHLAHAACNIIFLLDYQLRGLKEYDDRNRDQQR